MSHRVLVNSPLKRRIVAVFLSEFDRGMHPGEIATRAQTAIGGSIYAALKALVHLGWLSAQEGYVPTQARETTIYKLTEEGRRKGAELLGKAYAGNYKMEIEVKPFVPPPVDVRSYMADDYISTMGAE